MNPQMHKQKKLNQRIIMLTTKKLSAIVILTFVFLFNITFIYAEDVHEWVISPTEVVKYGLAVPDFKPGKNSTVITPRQIKSIIESDLEISGLFVKVKNDKFVEQQRSADIATGKMNFVEWVRLGTAVLVLGEYESDGTTINVRCDVYDVSSQQVVFRKKYPAEIKNIVLLAHTISDDIISYYAAGRIGIARTKILYISNAHNPRVVDKKEVYMMDYDGGNKTRLTYDNNLAATPCWGANLTEFYYTSYKYFNPDLYGQYINSGKNWSISSKPGFNLSPNFSQKLNKIVLTLGKDGNSEVYIMDRDGKNLKRLTFNKYIDSSPSWFPSGNNILFTSDRSGRPQVYVMDADGLNQRRLTFQGRYNDSSVCSPKEDRIAFAGSTGGKFNIFTMDTSGNHWLQLTSSQGNNEDPSWAPDGEHIVFTSDRTGRPNIYIMNADGSNVRQLTKEGLNISAAWSPLLYK